MPAEDLDQERQDDLRWVLSTEQGRRFVSDLVYLFCKHNDNAYTGDANATAYNLGRRAVGSDLLRLLERPEFLGSLKRLECERIDALSTHHVPRASESSP